MAGDWIKMRTDLAEDPAVIAMAAQLDVDEFAIVGRLHHLWSWFDNQSRDGHAAGVTRGWIDRKTQQPGFAAAMESVHWLSIDADGAQLPNFERHNGKTSKARALTTIRKQASRANGHGVVTEHVTDASRNERDRSVTREEKRREEKKEQKQDAPPAVAPLTLLTEQGVEPQLAKDFLAIRKAKRQPLTKTALAGIVREGAKAGLSLEETLRVCCDRGWAGYNPEWAGARPGGSGSPEPEYRRQLL